MPAAEVVHHEQLATDVAARERRLVEFHRGRDRYLRKHHGAGGGARRAPALRLELRASGRWPRRCFPATIRRSIGCTRARRSIPTGASGLREAAAAYNLAGDLNGGRDTAAANGA